MQNLVVLNEILKRLQGMFGEDLLGVLAGGSRMRSGGDLHSDIDVVVVVNRLGRKRWNFLIDGIEIETLINPPFQMRRYFEEERSDGRGVMPHLCSTGHIIFDPQRLMVILKAEAQAIWDAGPPPLSDTERWQFRYHAADLLRDLADVGTKDVERAAFLIGVIVPIVLNQHYRISGRWLIKPKMVLVDLGTWDKMAANLARCVCDQSIDPVERVSVLRTLVDHILAPIGGVMPLEWHTGWEELKP